MAALTYKIAESVFSFKSAGFKLEYTTVAFSLESDPSTKVCQSNLMQHLAYNGGYVGLTL